MTLLGWLRVRGLDWPQLLVGALALVVVLALGVASVTSAAAFGLYNPGWEGTSDFRDAIQDDPTVEHEMLREPDRYDALDPEGTVAFVLAPDDPYDDEAAAHVRQFVADGGTLVVLENFGANGDELLERVGADARTDGRLVLDEQHNYRGPAMPVATGVEPHALTADVDELTLNYATALEPGNATVLVTTSEYGYLGENATDEPGDDDELAAYPVATVEAVGDGTVVAVGDPSIAINAMYAEPDNARFLTNLYADADRVAFDLSRADELPPLTAAILTVRATPLLQGVLGLAGVGVALALSATRVTPALRALRNRLPERHGSPTDDRHAPGLSDEEVAAVIQRQHPEWDPERVERVIEALNNSKSKPGDNQ